MGVDPCEYLTLCCLSWIMQSDDMYGIMTLVWYQRVLRYFIVGCLSFRYRQSVYKYLICKKWYAHYWFFLCRSSLTNILFALSNMFCPINKPKHNDKHKLVNLVDFISICKQKIWRYSRYGFTAMLTNYPYNLLLVFKCDSDKSQIMVIICTENKYGLCYHWYLRANNLHFRTVD